MLILQPSQIPLAAELLLKGELGDREFEYDF